MANKNKVHAREFRETYKDFVRLSIGNILESDKVLYFNSSFWIKPTIEKFSYKKDISLVKLDFKTKCERELIKGLNRMFNDEYIYSFECKSEHMLKDKKTFVFMEILLKQNKNLSLIENHSLLMDKFRTVMESVTDKLIGFGYELTEKKRGKKLIKKN